MIIPVVTGDIDPGAVEALIALCVRYHQIRAAAPDPIADPVAGIATPDGAAVPAGLTGSTARHADQAAAAAAADALATMDQQILGKILQVVSGPGGAASFPASAPARQAPGRAVPAAGRGPDRRHPAAPAPPGRAARPALPVPRRVLPLSTHHRSRLGVV